MRFGRTLVALVCLLVVCALGIPAASAAVLAGDGGELDESAFDTAAVQNQTNGDSEADEDTRANESVDPEAIDELVEAAMDENDVAGASVAVVEGDEIVHAEGYGYADYEADEAVDADETSFMVGSVSKLFVWTAVMQGVEEGTLDLDEPVGTYLEDYSFEGDDEVTLEHLGTHSAGYEDRIEGVFVEEYDGADDWEAKLEREMPARVRDPGETVAYSNHGTALAGLVLQEVYDEPFAELVEERIFDPLAMDGATFEQPIPDDRATVSRGHAPAGDGFETSDPTVVGIPPAGSMTATPSDMGNFAIAKLQGGEFEDERLLETESVDAMFERRATNHPDVDGVGYGYMRTEYAGEEVVWHDGATENFHTLFALFPEHDVGFYVSFNTPTGGLVDVFDGFVAERFGDGAADSAAAASSDGGEPAGSEGDGERFLGNAGVAELEPDPATADRADRYEGEYRSTRFRTTHEKVLGLAQSVTVTVTEEGYLELENPLVGSSTRWVEVEPGVFELAPEEEPQLLTTLAIEDGTLYRGTAMPPSERVSWYETANVQLGLTAAVFALLFSTLLVWPASAYRSRGWGRMREHLTRPRLAVLGCVVLLLAFLVGLVATAIADPNQFLYGYSLWLRLVLGLLLVLAIAAVATLALAGLEWRRAVAARDFGATSTNRYGLAYLTVLAVALLVFVWQVWYWNLLTAAF